MRNPSRSTKLALLLVFCLTLLAYANCLQNDFIWDDHSVIVKNDFIKSWSNLPLVFGRKYLTRDADLNYLGESFIGSGEISYRPLVTLSYFLDHSIAKLNAFYFHLVNLLLHAGNAALVYFIAVLISADQRLALLASLFFALHPVNSEAVNVVSFREDLLAFFFCAAAFLLFLKSKKGLAPRKQALLYGLSLLSFLLALFSKEAAIVTLCFFLLYDYIFGYLKERSIPGIYKLRYLGYGAIALFYFIVRFLLLPSAGLPRMAGGMSQMPVVLFTMAKVFGVYMRWLFLPLRIHSTLPDDSGLIAHSFLDPGVMASVALIAVFIAIAVKSRKTLSLLSFGILWFFFSLLPVSNIFFPLTNYMAARHLYFASAGFALSMAFILTPLSGNIFFGTLSFRRIANILLVLIVPSYIILTAATSAAWKDDVVFWAGMAKRYPKNAIAHSSLGGALANKGLIDEAIGEYKKALALDTGYAADHNALGACYFKKGMFNEAEAEFRLAVRMDPAMLNAYINLGGIYGQRELYAEAEEYFKKALAINPGYAGAYNALGVNYARMNKWAHAREAFEKALKVLPGYTEAQANLRKLKTLGH